MISFFRPSNRRRIGLGLAIFLALQVGAFPALVSRKTPPVFAKSADDPVPVNRVAMLGPGVDPEEARLVVATAYNTGRELAKTWHVMWPPGLQNFLVNTGRRKGGLCFQWATELLVRLDALHLKTLELHWAEAYPGTASEHNVIAVTARGQPFEQGIFFDNWRYSGRLCWGPVNGDPEYIWKENKVAARARLERSKQERAAQRKAAAAKSGNAASQ